MVRSRCGMIAALLVGSALGCVDDGGAVGEAFTVRDSAGIPIAESQSPEIPGPLVPAGPHPLEPPPDVNLYRVRDLALIGGDLVVANGGSEEILVFSGERDFALSDRIGGEGEGPGEFRRLTAIHPCGDRAVVIESSDRLTFFSQGWIVEGTLPISSLGRGRPQVVGLSSDCEKVLVAQPETVSPSASGQIVELPQTVYWVDRKNSARDTVLTSPFRTALTWQQGDRLGLTLPPFGPQTALDLRDDRFVVGFSRDPAITLRGADGQARRIIRWSRHSEELSDGEWEAFTDMYEQFLVENPDARGRVPELSLYPRPEQSPAYSSLQLTSRGRLWVQRYGGFGPFSDIPSQVWELFDDTGRWLGTLDLDTELLQPVFTDSLVFGVTTDSLGVEAIASYRLPAALIR